MNFLTKLDMREHIINLYLIPLTSFQIQITLLILETKKIIKLYY
jgi:hypothetical protein